MKTLSNIKQLLIAATFFVGVTKTTAQMVNYKIVENDPDKRNLYIHLNPFNTQAYIADICIGYNVQATWLASNHIQLQLDYRKAYLDFNADGIFSPKGLKKSSQIEIGGNFNFVNKLKNSGHKVVLKSTTSGRYTTTSSIFVMGEARKIKSFRGGFLSFLSNHKIDNDFTKKADGVRGKTSDGEVKYLRDTINFETINYTVRSVGIYAGIDFKTIKQLVVNTDSYGEKSCSTVNNFYLDVLFTPLVAYDLKPNNGQASFSTVDINIPENKRKILGWRFGWQYTLNKPLGFNAKMEIGQQTGVTKGAFFMTFGFGATLGFKTKQLPI